MSEEHSIQLKTELQQLISADVAWNYKIIPKEHSNGKISFYIDEAFSADSVLQEIEILLGVEVEIEKVDGQLIQQTLNRQYRRSVVKSQSEFLSDQHSEDFLSVLILEARTLGSSDIHIEAYEDSGRIRIRIDGQLIERYIIKKAEYPSLINKIKIKANLDISEKRLPQDGRILFRHNEVRFDIRVSILPTLHGEKVVLRLLNNDASGLDINELGFSSTELKYYMEAVRRPHGLLLISGPTGSGKTTTLYSTLKLLNNERRNILTIEDPIEYTLPGINQVQLKENIGLSFSSALRTFLRQDPDIIMLGEIRDAETANMAIRAALTGHLVLSTVHTNSAWGTVSRLIDMGVPSFLLSNTLNTTVAQRLVRLLCPNCKKEKTLLPDAYPLNFVPPENLLSHFISQGCDHCHYTGYKGRKAIYEVIPIDNELSAEIRNSKHDIAQHLIDRKIYTLSDNAFNLFKNGLTTIDEIFPLLNNLN